MSGFNPPPPLQEAQLPKQVLGIPEETAPGADVEAEAVVGKEAATTERPSTGRVGVLFRCRI